jgi:hypothetical protein
VRLAEIIPVKKKKRSVSNISLLSKNSIPIIIMLWHRRYVFFGVLKERDINIISNLNYVLLHCEVFKKTELVYNFNRFISSPHTHTHITHAIEHEHAIRLLKRLSIEQEDYFVSLPFIVYLL